MYSVELVKLTGANFESNIYKPGSVAQFKCIEAHNVAKNRYAFRIWFSAMKKTTMLKTSRYFEMTVICSNSGQGCIIVGRSLLEGYLLTRQVSFGRVSIDWDLLVWDLKVRNLLSCNREITQY